MKRLAFAVLAALLLMARGDGSASAHPLGGAIINRYARLDTYQGTIRVTYMLDYDWLATIDNLHYADTTPDRQYSSEELQRFADGVERTYDYGLRLRAGNTSLNLVVQTTAIVLRPDPYGFPTMKLTFVYDAAVPRGLTGPVQVEFEDLNFEDNQVWKEIVVRGSQGAVVTIPPDFTVERSQQLDSYPPLDAITIPGQDKADWTWQAGTGAAAPAVGQPAAPGATAGITPGPSAAAVALPRSRSFLDLRVVILVGAGVAAWVGGILIKARLRRE